MRLHIIIESGEGENVNLSSPAPVAVPEPKALDTMRPAKPPKARASRLSEGHMKSAALGRKPHRPVGEATGPTESFEDIANAVAASADALPFTPKWMRRKRAGN